ncbi:MAG: hypothetical protein KDC87_11320 [Planctomycetes bacterium]|nr:hypothetical protein [Planctomycetota bacterium]MCB9869126.1 hypothetical protein [Planctomycetota bacterium]MCB9889038.1 hypothetical protein [Planctomycetota bacterium]
MVLRPALLVLLVVTGAEPLRAQHMHLVPNLYKFELPAGWRQMTPDEARALRDRMPAELDTLLVVGRIDRFGAIDRWMTGDFDGRCLTVTVEDGEPEMGESTLAEVRARAAKSPGAAIERLELTEVGPDRRPAIACTATFADAKGVVTARTSEFVVPSGGHTIRFSFHARAADWASAEPGFRRCIATLQTAAKAEGRKELSDQLQKSLIIGALVGLVLLVLYKTRRR